MYFMNQKPFLLGTVTDFLHQSKKLEEKTMAPDTPVSAMATFEMMY